MNLPISNKVFILKRLYRTFKVFNFVSIQSYKMKKNILVIFCITFLLNTNFGANNNAHASIKQFHLSPNVKPDDYIKNAIIFRLKSDYRNIASNASINHSALNQYLNSIGSNGLQKKFPLKQAPAQERNKRGDKLVDLSLIYEFNYTQNIDIEKVINALLSLNLFEYAEPHYLPKTLYIPSDPEADTVTGHQYHLKNIHAYEGWDIDKGDTNVVIGITDTGFDFTHDDLKGNVKINSLDPPDGVDNDHDGYIDNYKGWDLGEFDNNPQYVIASPHGVFVSGCAGGTTDNAIGIAGSGFKCKLLPIKISDANGNLTASYEGIVYAVDHGCQIINCSWGGTGGNEFGQNIVDYATFNANAVVLAAAGNNDNETVFYPAAFNNVINVGGSDATDKKWKDPNTAGHGSNYGIHIDVCAPGDELYSTWAPNTYLQGATSGTSFACPIAAGVAGIIKSHFPNYTAKQIGEQLKVSCDNMDVLPQNAPYVGKLGHGRINLYRALTDTTSPSVEINNYTIDDHNDNAIAANDTVRFTGEFKNYLAPTSNLTITLGSTSPYISILNNSYTLGTLGTLATTSNSMNPFTFRIHSNTPTNQSIVLKFTFHDGNYNAFQYIEMIVNVDYINIDINDIVASFASNGRIGYSLENQVGGAGFKYIGNSSILYEASFMLGNSSTQVSDAVRGDIPFTDNDFAATTSIHRVIPSVVSELDLEGIFNDINAGSPIGVVVKHNNYAWSTPGNAKYIIQKYTIYNKGIAPLSSLYAGIFADWDIQNSSLNKADFDSINSMGYIYSTQANGVYAGIKLLTRDSGLFVNSIDNVAGGAGGIDFTGGFSTAEKYQSLSTNRYQAGNTTTNGNDVAHTVSAGPFHLAVNDSVIVAFALIAGDDLIDLQNSAIASQHIYDSLYAVGISSVNKNEGNILLFPNPASNNILVQFAASINETATISIYTISGQEVKKIKPLVTSRSSNFQQLKIDLSDLDKGVYFLRIQSEHYSATKKLVIAN